MEQAVDEADKQVFVYLCTEQFLETEVGVRVDVSVFEVSAFHNRNWLLMTYKVSDFSGIAR